jgi:hypothetical protein
MTIIHSKSELRNQNDKYVVHQDTVYERHDDEYIAKLYFRISDVMGILNKSKTEVHWLLNKHNIKIPTSNKYERIKISLLQLRQMAKTPQS